MLVKMANEKLLEFEQQVREMAMAKIEEIKAEIMSRIPTKEELFPEVPLTLVQLEPAPAPPTTISKVPVVKFTLGALRGLGPKPDERYPPAPPPPPWLNPPPPPPATIK